MERQVISSKSLENKHFKGICLLPSYLAILIFVQIMPILVALVIFFLGLGLTELAYRRFVLGNGALLNTWSRYLALFFLQVAVLFICIYSSYKAGA
jgi:hypothetical protein